jgi:hypothetical protein
MDDISQAILSSTQVPISRNRRRKAAELYAMSSRIGHGNHKYHNDGSRIAQRRLSRASILKGLSSRSLFKEGVMGGPLPILPWLSLHQLAHAQLRTARALLRLTR